MKETNGTAEDVAAECEAVEDLSVVAVEVFEANLERMFADEEREIILQADTIEEFA